MSYIIAKAGRVIWAGRSASEEEAVARALAEYGKRRRPASWVVYAFAGKLPTDLAGWVARANA
jgi:hypothetical protein